MNKINFTAPDDESWNKWIKKCRAKTQEIIIKYKNNEKIKISSLYKKPVLKSIYSSKEGPFSGNCAYCESDTIVNQTGDIDHFRPKKKVTDINNDVVYINKSDGSNIPHPGYYWLTYDYKNLLFTCISCNRVVNSKEGKKIGKGNRFPVKDFRAINPGDETKETPLLINPMVDEPNDHLHLMETGIFKYKTEKGEKSIEVLGLNDRMNLVNSRKEVIRNTIKEYCMAVISITRENEDAQEYIDKIKSIENSLVPYATAAKLGLSIARVRNKIIC